MYGYGAAQVGSAFKYNAAPMDGSRSIYYKPEIQGVTRLHVPRWHIYPIISIHIIRPRFDISKTYTYQAPLCHTNLIVHRKAPHVMQLVSRHAN